MVPSASPFSTPITPTQASTGPSPAACLLYHNLGTGDITELVGTWLRQLGALGVVGASSGLLVPQLPALAL